MRVLLALLLVVGMVGSSNESEAAEPLTLKGHRGAVKCVSFTPDGKRIVSGSGDKTVKVWDAQTGQETLTLKGHLDNVNGVSFSPDGKRIVSGSYDKTVKVWDVATGQESLTLKRHSGYVLRRNGCLGQHLPSASHRQSVIDPGCLTLTVADSHSG